MPYHAYKYDMMRLYDDCALGLKRAMYRHQVTRALYKPDFKNLNPKLKFIYNKTWMLANVVEIRGDKLKLKSDIFNAPRITVDEWKRKDKRHMPP